MPAIPRAKQLAPQFRPQEIEQALYERWVAAGVFSAHAADTERAGGSRTPFVVMMPPPNVTAVLHMGHGLNNTVQDLITRWRRMSGDEALWLPGTDHAGIATQNIVEKQLAAEGLTRFDLGRDAFVARTTEHVGKTGGTILDQLRAIGASCDWSRTAYTLSPELSRAVREAFVQLYERGLIYRGHRVIHWCPRCLTALSDEEAEHSEEQGKLYHVRYRVIREGSQTPEPFLTVATTRPETMLGDVALAVHPDDPRYTHFHGARAVLPISHIEIPVITDAEAVDPAFGTGALKITPAHDANDFEVGVRHKLPTPGVMTPGGRMEDPAEWSGRVPAELQGIDRFEARERVVEMLRESGDLVRVEQHAHGVRHCYRCDTVVEPRLSDQWFVRMKPLAEPALAAVRERRIRILPERWEAVYVNWMENIRDWNISRQLWWGHRIPIWYCDDCGEISTGRDDVTLCPKCGGSTRQDEDVLDTWFSSWLWPFSTLGWPDKNDDLRAFYPGDHLYTAPEILFFWVARMIMAGYAFMDEAPFHTVYLHGTVRDMEHRKMSKSLGNGIDPLDVVSLYGADALRYTVISGLGVGADLMLDPDDLEKTFAPGRNFATKLWNIARFLLTNVGDSPVRGFSEVEVSRLARSDRWILAKLNDAIADCNAALGPARPADAEWTEEETRSGLRLNEYCETARRFVWNELADWYLESVKGRLAGADEDAEIARTVLVHVFNSALRLLHPIVPFITEALWQQLPATGETRCESIATSTWPARDRRFDDEREFDLVREAVVALRQLRAEYAIPPGEKLDARLVGASDHVQRLFSDESDVMMRLARCHLHVDGDMSNGSAPATLLLTGGARVVVSLKGVVDVDRECSRARSELERLEKQLAVLAQRLENPGFTRRAPSHVVEAERTKLGEWSARRTQLIEKVRSLCGT